MPSTFQGVAAVLIAVLPGALYIWAYERVVGRWGIGLTDRLLRFVGISVALHVAGAPITYHLWHAYLRHGALPADHVLPLWLWYVALGYVAVPIALGTIVGRGATAEAWWAKFLIGASKAPTAWDAIFSGKPEGWVLLRLKSGRWIGGAFTDKSYTAGYPEDADIFLSAEGLVDQETEMFVLDDQDQPVTLGWGVLVRWNEVEYLEVTPVEGFR